MTGNALMMAAMMMPGALPALHRSGRALVFAVSYLALWGLAGAALYALHEPGAATAGALTIAAGVYELTPVKRSCRLRCQETLSSGFEFGAHCIGASIGFMVMLTAIGAMGIAWISIVAALVLFQKLVPPRAAFDLPLALAIVALGVVIAIAPDSVPGAMPAGM